MSQSKKPSALAHAHESWSHSTPTYIPTTTDTRNRVLLPTDPLRVPGREYTHSLSNGEVSGHDSCSMPKRAADEDGTLQQDHLARIAAAAEFQHNSRRKQVSSSRTGQACDRCKNNSECKTTDRITGRATTRGHTEHLENENASLRMYMIELQAQLREKGIEPRPAPVEQQAYLPVDTPSGYEAQEYGALWGNAQGSRAERERQDSPASLLPAFRSGDIGENYLGVASETAWLSPIEGTSLALFGTKIDIAEFMPPEPNEEAIATSYETFVSYAFGSASASAPPLPNFEECEVYAKWYFRFIQAFIPILHKPAFMDLLTNVYHKGHQMTAAETVMLHMVLAVMNFQWSKRNRSEQSRSNSFKHYHYALTFIPTLITSHRLEDLQALTLICSQLRNQGRPGAAYMFVNMVMGLAIESGLHRSAKAWPTGSQDPHTMEMRKRVFWSLMVFHVTIGGKLGRPMPLRIEDFDVEIPDPVHDNLPSEANMTKWKKCSFRAGIHGFKGLKLMMKVYSTLYSVRTTNGAYEFNMRQLERELSAFQAQIPAELTGGPQTHQEDKVFAHYLQIIEAECQLLLHHPSICRASSPGVTASNLETCLQTSSKILNAATQLKTLRSLDTTWYHSTIYVAAIFTTLFAHTERRDQLQMDDVQQLRQEMSQWLDVMGTGPRLQEAIRNIVDHSIDNISRQVAARTASAVVASTLSPDEVQDAKQQQPPSAFGNVRYSNSGQQQLHYSQPEYNIKGQSVGLSYTSPPVTYDSNSYVTNGSTSHPNIEAQIQALQHHQHQQQQEVAAPQNTSYLPSYQSPSQAQNGFLPPVTTHSQQYPPPSNDGPAAWRHFTHNMTVNMNGIQHSVADDPHYANTFMAFKPNGSTGADETTSVAANAYDLGTGAPLSMQIPIGQQTWPLLPYVNIPPDSTSAGDLCPKVPSMKNLAFGTDFGLEGWGLHFVTMCRPAVCHGSRGEGPWGVIVLVNWSDREGCSRGVQCGAFIVTSHKTV
nr:transcriptional activator protein acu-15 [Quercus suber]